MHMTKSNTITKHLKWLLLNRSRVRQCTVHFIMDHFTEFELDVRTRSVNTCREHQKVAPPTYQRAKQSAGSRGPEARRQTTSSLPRPWWPLPTPPAGRNHTFPRSRSYQETPTS